MAVEWFYTTNKQQMGPVTWEELRELADKGLVKASDMVWTEGMGEWVKAIQQDGLFSDGQSTSVTPKKGGPKPPPARRTQRKADEEDEDEEDEREVRKKARRKKDEKTKMAVGVKVGLILGGVMCVLLMLLCAGGVLVWVAFTGKAPANVPKGVNPPPVVGIPQPNALVRDNYTIINLNEGQRNSRTYTFTQGRQVIITVTNNLMFPNTDVDLHVFQGNLIIAQDIDVPPQQRNCRVQFQVPATGVYRVEVENLGPGRANSCVVSIQEQ